MKELLTFDDVLIVPKFSEIESRKDVDLSVIRLGYRINLPVIAANMDTVCDAKMAKAMYANGAIACLPRFTSIDDNVTMFRESEVCPMVSIGLGDKELERAIALHEAGAHCFTIDVAHGAQLSVVEQAKALREIIKSSGCIVVGNFATGESVKTFLEHSDNIVDAFKVGVGPGASCLTRVKTGVGYPQLSAIIDISNTLKKTGITVIADGGLKTAGDYAKALGAGAHLTMAGKMLAGTDESPGEIVSKEGKEVDQELAKKGFFAREDYRKKFRGSASKESYQAQGKEAKHRTAEGDSFLIPYKGPVSEVLQDIEGGIRSSFSYVGANTLAEFHNRVEFVRVTNAGYVEGTSHGRHS